MMLNADRKSRRFNAPDHDEPTLSPKDALKVYADVRVAAVWNSCRSTARHASPRKPIGSRPKQVPPLRGHHHVDISTMASNLTCALADCG